MDGESETNLDVGSMNGLIRTFTSETFYLISFNGKFLVKQLKYFGRSPV